MSRIVPLHHPCLIITVASIDIKKKFSYCKEKYNTDKLDVNLKLKLKAF